MENQPPARKSRTRERHERRKARQQVLPSAAARSVPRQLRPAGSFKLPEIRLPQGKLLLYGVAGVVLIIAVIFILGRLTNDTPQTGNNAIWLGNQWTYDNPADEALNGLVKQLQTHQIGTVYAWVSLLQPDGMWSDTIKLPQVKDFAARFRQAYPEAELYGWLSIAAQGLDGSNRLGDTATQQQIADFSRRVTEEFGFDGVLLNIVPVLNNDENFVMLLRKVRATLGEDMSLAVAVPPDWTPADEDVPQPPQIAPNTVWDANYKKRVALLSNQMVITAYNSGLETANDYAAWVAYQVEAFTDVISEMDTTTQLVISVPAYDTVSPEHNPAVENIAAAASGVKQGLQRIGEAAQFVHGLAIYAEWETDEADWQQFDNTWLR